MSKKLLLQFLLVILFGMAAGFDFFRNYYQVDVPYPFAKREDTAPGAGNPTPEINSSPDAGVSPVAQKKYRTIKLYYYNGDRDNDQCSSKGLFSVERQIPDSNDIKDTIKDAIDLLMEGRLNIKEELRNEGGFPLYNVNLDKVALDKNGVLSLTFSDPDYQTTGGSCYVNILAMQISATAAQFPQVKQVKLEPQGKVFDP